MQWASAMLLALTAKAAPPTGTRGELLFQTCTACHSVLGDGLGPNLRGVYGKKAASRPDYPYSDALKSGGLVWDEPTLKLFLRNPQALVKGTKMTFPGYAVDADIDAVIAYLKTLE